MVRTQGRISQNTWLPKWRLQIFRFSDEKLDSIQTIDDEWFSTWICTSNQTLPTTSVTRLGDFWTFLGTKFLAKVAQIFGNILG